MLDDVVALAFKTLKTAYINDSKVLKIIWLTNIPPSKVNHGLGNMTIRNN